MNGTRERQPKRVCRIKIHGIDARGPDHTVLGAFAISKLDESATRELADYLQVASVRGESTLESSDDSTDTIPDGLAIRISICRGRPRGSKSNTMGLPPS
jgi:hypothetical protein